ncbi:MAG: NUDIX domain-containing protein [Alphaproteobacteria bacterium]
MTQRLQMVIGVHLILRRGQKVLLARRFNTGWGDGQYNFPCGHLDDGEQAVDGLVREAREETGVIIKPRDLVFAGATHWQSSKQSVNLFFECRTWKGEPVNGEPDKCDGLQWFALHKTPRNIVPQTRAVLKACRLRQRPFFIEKLG